MIEVEFWSFGYFANGFSLLYGCVWCHLGTDFVREVWVGEDVEELPVDEEGGVDYQGPENLGNSVGLPGHWVGIGNNLR